MTTRAGSWGDGTRVGSAHPKLGAVMHSSGYRKPKWRSQLILNRGRSIHHEESSDDASSLDS